MNSNIYLISENDALSEMKESQFESEDALQELLALYPKLLAGNQINNEQPRRWLLIKREVGVPDQEDGERRWSLDHLFVDQDAIPTLVEIKRSTDTRIRRRVVGQMLDYAANATIFWRLPIIRRAFEEQQDDADGALAELLEQTPEDVNADAFWEQVGTNLKAGKVRMLFVADKIPVELQRIIEFLNEQMTPAEVLGLELKYYEGKELRTLVPRIIGKVNEQSSSSSSKSNTKWDEASFFEDLSQKRNGATVQLVRELYDGCKKEGYDVWWGTGIRDGAFVPRFFTSANNKHQIFAVRSSGHIELYFYWYKNRPPFDQQEKRQELAEQLNEITGINIGEGDLDRRPNYDLGKVLSKELKVLWDTFNWFRNEIEKQEQQN